MLLVVSVLKPIKWAPDEYALISQWDNEDALKAFAGEQWNHAGISPVMEIVVADCWMHHYDSWAEASSVPLNLDVRHH